METVGVIVPGAPTSRFFNREYEKTPSPEKEKEKEKEEVEDWDDAWLDANDPGLKVLDFTHLELQFAKKVEPIPEREPRPGDKAVADLPKIAVSADGTVLELVNQECIRALLKSPPRNPNPLPDCSVETLRAKGIKEDGIEILSRSCQNLQRVRDIKNDIIQQYLDKGYAYVELPASDERYPATSADLPPLP